MVARKDNVDIKLYDVTRKTPVQTRPTRGFLQDLNLLMATHRLSAADIIRGSVSAQADAVRERIHNRLNKEV